jgi:RNase P/RNase MRP subunit POP5
MSNLKDLTVDDLENLIEQKVLELLGDPDSGLELRQEFKEELSRRLKNRGVTTSHQEVIKKFA